MLDQEAKGTMSTTKTKKRGVILLNYSAGHATVEPQDEDRFVISAEKAVDACLEGHRQDEFISQFKSDFIQPLRGWCEDHMSRVKGCYVPPPAGHIAVFVIGSSTRYDFDLGREISKLELTLVDRGWQVNVLQIPMCEAEEMRSYFNPDGALVIYGEGDRASDESGG